MLIEFLLPHFFFNVTEKAQGNFSKGRQHEKAITLFLHHILTQIYLKNIIQNSYTYLENIKLSLRVRLWLWSNISWPLKALLHHFITTHSTTLTHWWSFIHSQTFTDWFHNYWVKFGVLGHFSIIKRCDHIAIFPTEQQQTSYQRNQMMKNIW